MTTIAEKLRMWGRQELVVVNAPESFYREMAQLPALAIHTHLECVAETGFVLAFVRNQLEVERLTGLAAAKTPGDARLWFAYPKKSSKRLKCNFDHDHAWEKLEAAGFEKARAISIDGDWTALGFRRSEFVKRHKK